MLNILALEASVEACSVALLTSEQELIRISYEPRQHAQALLPMVDELLEEAQLSLAELHGIAYACGPGSFTGLRIGFSMAQGLAFGSGLPMIPVNSLQVLAHRARQHYHERAQGALVALDARMGELYWAAYQWQDPQGSECIAPQLQTVEHAGAGMQNWLSEQSDSRWLAAGPGMTLVTGLQADNLIAVDAGQRPDALAVAQLARMQPLNANAQPADQAQLLYLRNSVSWNKRRRIRT